MATIGFWHSELVNQLGRMARSYARPFLASKSRTLARSLTVEQRVPTRPSAIRVAVSLPHYWALYVNDGRPAFSNPKVMVFFRDPRNDPRLSAGYPVRKADIKRGMSPAEWQVWQAENAISRALGLPRPMVVTKTIYKDTTAKRFFENDGGMAGFPVVARYEIRRQVSELTRSQLGPFLNRKLDVQVL